MSVDGSTGISPPFTSGGLVVVVVGRTEVVGVPNVVVVTVPFEQAAIRRASTAAWRIRFVTFRNVTADRRESVVYPHGIMTG